MPTEAEIERAVAITGHARLRELVGPDAPDDERKARYAAFVETVARTGVIPSSSPPPAYPSLAVQAANLAKAAVGFAASGLATVDRAEYDRRRGICEGCPLFDAKEVGCTKCGCYLAVKPWMKSEHCPDGRW